MNDSHLTEEPTESKGDREAPEKPLWFRKRSCPFVLSANGIDEVSEWLVGNLKAEGVDKSDRLRMRLLFEEALLDMADYFGDEQEGTAVLERRQGRFRLRIAVRGERFNPLRHRSEEDGAEWSTSLFSVIDLQAQYSYSMGTNVLRLSLPRQSLNPVLMIAIALAAGAFIGLVGTYLIPDSAEAAFSDAVLSPISDMWVRLLQAISGPIIFLTALTAAFGTKRIADFGGSRITTLLRYFAIGMVVVLFALFCSRLVFPLDVASTEDIGSVLSRMFGEVLKVVPGNLVEPFVAANTPQILIVAIATGYLLASMEPQLKELNTVIRQLNTLGLTVARLACSLVPFFVGLLLCLRIWTHETALLGAIWVPLALSLVVSVAVLLAVLLATSVRFRVSPLLLARKLKGPFVEALKRGTLDFSAVGNLVDSCKRHLGIDGAFAEAALPLGLFLYMPTSGVGICVFVLFAADMQQLSVDHLWFVAVAFLSAILAVATPPMTGANLLSFVVAFSYLGISSDAFLDVMVFDIVLGVFCIAFDQAMLQIETITQAERMGFLDVDVLRAPLE